MVCGKVCTTFAYLVREQQMPPRQYDIQKNHGYSKFKIHCSHDNVAAIT